MAMTVSEKLVALGMTPELAKLLYDSAVLTDNAVALAGAQTITGDKTFSGTTAFTGLVSLTRAAVAAAGSDAAGAAVISTQIAAVTAADGAKGVALPAAATTVGPILVINTVLTASLKVYPVSGGNDQINGLAEDLPISLRPGEARWFIPTSATQWYTQDSAIVMTKGAGVSSAESYAIGVEKTGTLITTTIVVDLTGLVGSATDTDIIGNTGGAASCHWGQITAALNGAIVGGKVTCLEVPAGGAADINFYSANESTGAQDALATSLTETVLIDAGGNWTSGMTKGMTTVPPANDYLYIANGAASGGTFTAGKFEITLYGYAA